MFSEQTLAPPSFFYKILQIDIWHSNQAILQIRLSLLLLFYLADRKEFLIFSYLFSQTAFE